jgi:hypothetical protein
LNLLHGVYQPQQTIVQLEPAERAETGTDEIERTLAALRSEKGKAAKLN